MVGGSGQEERSGPPQSETEMIYVLPSVMIVAGAALVLSLYRERKSFSVPLLSDHAKIVLAGCLIFFGICIFIWLVFPDIAAKVAPISGKR